MLGGVLEPGGETICVPVDLKALALPWIAGLLEALLLSDMLAVEKRVCPRWRSIAR
jgi:hypothetical protein